MLLIITKLMTSVIKERKSIFRNKPTYSKDRYNNRRRTSRPSFGIFCFKHGEIIEDTKYLMVMRRNSYAYEEFIRGSYHIDDINYIRQLMSRITKSEADRIINSEFEELWEDLNKAYSVTTTDPYKLHLAKENFYKIKNNANLYNFDEENRKNIKWNDPEWCFPKGKKNNQNEDDIECSKRELFEETKLTEDDYNLKTLVPRLIKYEADNGVTYENTFYFAEVKELKEIEIDNSDERQKAEVGKIEWLSKEECREKIRDYHTYILDTFEKCNEVCDGLFNLVKKVI